uniref:TRASH domain-containing protein n=1 Tax=Anopheles gambiae TaxID=7165 RepID=A0ABK8F364_ANOGA
MEEEHREENDSNPNSATGDAKDDTENEEKSPDDVMGDKKENATADSKEVAGKEAEEHEQPTAQETNENPNIEELASDCSNAEPSAAQSEPVMSEAVSERMDVDDAGKEDVPAEAKEPLHEEASAVAERPVNSKPDDKDDGESEKYDSAVEEMETDQPGDQDQNPTEESESKKPVAANTTSVDDPMKVDEEHEHQQQVVKPLDDVSNTSSHLQDIEVTNVDESDHTRGDDMPEGDRSIDPSTAEDPFDQLRHASTDDISHGDKDNQNETATEMEGVDKQELPDEHPEGGDNDTADKGNDEGENDDEHGANETLQSAATSIAEENTVDETGKDTTGVGEEQTVEDESNAIVEEERGGENENICLLPDDERAISDEDNQRAMEQEEAAAEQQSLAAERDEAEAEAAVRAEGSAARGAEHEGEVEEGPDGFTPPAEREAAEGQDSQPATVEQAEEMEVDLTSTSTEELPARDNQIRELATILESETCMQCKKDPTPCLYMLTCDAASEETAQKYICSFDCVQRLRTDQPGKFELIQRRVTIVPILERQETCARCGEQQLCKYRYKLDDATYTYLCDLKCVEHLTAINSEKYSLMRKRYNIEEKSLAQEEDKRCVQCGDTKPCQFGFKQDEDEMHVCSDCVNLLMTEHPDLFRLHRRRSVRVRNLVKESAIGSGSAGSGANASSEVVKFTARTEEEAEAARIEREASFLRTCHECHKTLQILSSRWLQWETMEFCDEKCLGAYQTSNGSHCVQCRQVVSVNSMGKFCVRFGFSICQFCSARCLEEYKKVLKSCSYCQQSITKHNKGYEFRVARAGEPGVLKDFCSTLCHKMYQACLNPTLKHKRHVCAVCNHEKMTKVIVHLEGREHYFCSTPCFSAFKFVNNVNPDECAMCKDFFERKSSAAYTIYRQGEASHLDPLAFCTKMCLNLYISTNREIVPCNWCKVKKYTFDMILRPSTMERHCSLHCLTLCEVSTSVKLTPCDHCRLVRTAQYELNMTDSSLRIFCTYQCLMKFQSQFNKSQPIDPSIPVPMGIPKRIPRATTTATISHSNTAAQVSATKMALTSARTTADTTSTPNITTPTPRPRGRPPKSAATQASSTNSGKNGNVGSAGSNLPVITSVHSLAGAMNNRGTRSKGGQMNLNQKNWPELRVALEPLTNIPPSGRVALSSILPNINARTEISLSSASPTVGSSSKNASVTTSAQTSTFTPPPETDSMPASDPEPTVAAPPPAPTTVTVTKVETHTQIVTIPPTPTQVANASTMCKPIQLTKSVSCRPIQCNVGCQTDDWLQRKLVIPIPVPIYVPVPMFMYSMPTPVPVPIPLPIPVPVFVPTTRNSANGIMKEIKKIQDKMPTDPYEAELLMMAEMVAGDKKKDDSDSDSDDGGVVGDDQYTTTEAVVASDGMEHNTSFSEDLVQMALKMASNDFSESQVDLESAMQANTITQQQQQHHGYEDLQQHHHQQQQLLLLEQQRQVATPVVQRGRKRGSNVSQRAGTVVNNNTQQLSLTPTSKRIKREQLNEPSPEPVNRVVEPVEKPDANMCLKYTFGVNAWKQWVVTKNADLEKSSIRRKPFKSDILQLTADELNYSLCLFVNEVRKPNGTEYAPDTIYYLVLGIQQYLFQNRRVENIFTDPYYERFTDCLDEVAKKFSMLYNDSQFIVTRVEEEHLWECKQLGAHSPHVLLSTLMFFNTKHFNLVSVEEHMELSFSHIMKHWKRTPQQGTKSTATRNVLLRFYPPQSSLANNTRKKKVYEQQENEENPLRCPVKLYEFYLSKCPESVKTRNDVFYLQPERSCVPDSPVWYSTQPLSKEALTKMLHRVKMVKEINIALLTS